MKKLNQPSKEFDLSPPSYREIGIMLCSAKLYLNLLLKMSSFLKMPQLSSDQRTWLCLEMASAQNATEAIRRWPAQWPNIPPSSRKIGK